MSVGSSVTSPDAVRSFTAASLLLFVTGIFKAVGSSEDEAHLVASHLVEANLVGHDSHGVMRVQRYVDLVRSGKLISNQHVQLVQDRGASILVDGQFGYGQVVAGEAMALGAERASQHGFALVALRNAGHLGRVGAWAEALADKGLVSLHFVNSSGFGILVAPHGGSDRRLSSNPIAAGIPVAGGPPIILDFATSAVAEGKIQIARNKGEQLRAGEIIDAMGQPTTDPGAFYAEPPGAILPFGAHKGSGLSILCEVLAGSLTGGFASHPASPTAGQLVNNMLSFVIDTNSFAGSAFFGQDVRRLAEWIKASPPRGPGEGVLLPGDIERQTRREREQNGIPLDSRTWNTLVETAEALGVVVPARL